MRNEIFRPEQFGYENTERNSRLFYAISTRTPAYVFNDNGSLSPILDTLRDRTGMDICQIDLDEEVSKEDIFHATGIYLARGGAYKVDRWQNRDAYLVIRRFDRFVLENKDRMQVDSEADGVMHVIKIAEKYGGGTMISFEGDDWNAVSEVARNTFWLREFLLDFAALTTIK